MDDATDFLGTRIWSMRNSRGMGNTKLDTANLEGAINAAGGYGFQTH